MASIHYGHSCNYFRDHFFFVWILDVYTTIATAISITCTTYHTCVPASPAICTISSDHSIFSARGVRILFILQPRFFFHSVDGMLHIPPLLPFVITTEHQSKDLDCRHDFFFIGSSKQEYVHLIQCTVILLRWLFSGDACFAQISALHGSLCSVPASDPVL